MLPFVDHKSNRMQLAIASAYSWTCASLVIGYVAPRFDAAIMVYLGVPVAAAAGVLLVDRRAMWIFAAPISALHSAGAETKR